MRLTEEMLDLERRMVEDEERAENVVAVSAMALGCFALLALCWVIAWWLP